MNQGVGMIKVTCLSIGLIASAIGDDWPRWMGAESDGIWREDGVRTDLPAKGARVLWRVPVGWGYSGPSVAGGNVYLPEYVRTEGELMNNPGKAVEWKGSERLRCLDMSTGKEKWVFKQAVDYLLSYPGGPRSTPTIADGRVYFLGAMGHFTCLDAETGKVIWKTDFQKDFGAPLPIWGFSAHPLVKGDTVYCLVGGEGSTAVAFDAKSGKVKWKSLTVDKQGYCPPSIVKAGGVDQLIIWHTESINGLNPNTGEKYWSLPLKPNYGMSVITPRLVENRMFASAIGRVGAMIELDPDKPTASFAWKGKPKTALYCCNSTPIVVDGVIYGSDIDSNCLIAASWEDGKRFWQTEEPTMAKEHRTSGRHATVYLTLHEKSGKFWLVNESGDLILAELSKEGYKELGRQHVLEPTNEAFGRPVVWSAPAFAGKSVFMRNDKELVRVDLSK
ncbi:PQQ-like beta-propeller repeat protein [Akkermansiaceae bacterium]|nr:PQQ-like beta-propeller repeat protein [Akkermansiaceae bacterium]